MKPEGFTEFRKSGGKFGKGRFLPGEGGEGIPLGRCCGQSGEATLGVIAGTCGAGGPGRGSLLRELIVDAVLPPTGPKVFEPFPGFLRRGFVEIGGEESGGPEDDGLTVLGSVLVEFFNGKSLSEETHGEAVRGKAKSIGEGFPEGLGKPVEGRGLFKAFRFQSGAMKSGLFQQRGDICFRHLCQRRETDTRAGEGLGEAGSAEGGIDLVGRQDDPGDVAIV